MYNWVYVHSYWSFITCQICYWFKEKDNNLSKHDLINRQSEQNCQCKDGIPGPRGPRGSEGKVGMKGKQGRKRKMGLKGDTGPPGPRGDAGDRGPWRIIGMPTY